MPTPNFALERNERIYPFVQSAFGTATLLTGSAACRIVKFTADNTVPEIVRPDKTGSRSLAQGVPGRKLAKWSVDMSLAGNGAAGIAPDCDVFLQMLFGASPTIVASTSCTYALSDNIVFGTVYDYRQPSTIAQRVAHTMICGNAKFAFGENFARLTASGENVWTLGSDHFSIADATQKGGLASIPAEPGAPTTNGAAVIGFTGTITIDGTAVGEIQSGEVNITTGNKMIVDAFGSFYASGAIGAVREVTTNFTLYENDAAYLNNIRQKSITKSPITIVYQLGTVAGNIWTLTLNNVHLGEQSMDEQSDRFLVRFDNSRAYATSFTSHDEMALVIT